MTIIQAGQNQLKSSLQTRKITKSKKVSTLTSGPIKPKRALTAYNLFTGYLREKIINGTDNVGVSATVEDMLRISQQNKMKKRRPHRKSHGLISFKDLSKNIADRWKGLLPAEKQVFEAQAKLEKLERQAKLQEYQDQSAKRNNSMVDFTSDEGEVEAAVSKEETAPLRERSPSVASVILSREQSFMDDMCELELQDFQGEVKTDPEFAYLFSSTKDEEMDMANQDARDVPSHTALSQVHTKAQEEDDIVCKYENQHRQIMFAEDAPPSKECSSLSSSEDESTSSSCACGSCGMNDCYCEINAAERFNIYDENENDDSFREVLLLLLSGNDNYECEQESSLLSLSVDAYTDAQ